LEKTVSALPRNYRFQGLVFLIGILVFVGAFSVSMGPVMWVVLSEMFTNKIRSVAMSAAVVTQ
jgi:SP family xylose:H+ symportor-like MFS transporter